MATPYQIEQLNQTLESMQVHFVSMVQDFNDHLTPFCQEISQSVSNPMSPEQTYTPLVTPNHGEGYSMLQKMHGVAAVMHDLSPRTLNLEHTSLSLLLSSLLNNNYATVLTSTCNYHWHAHLVGCPITNAHLKQASSHSKQWPHSYSYGTLPAASNWWCSYVNSCSCSCNTVLTTNGH
jgi:hypothetical protein